MSLAGRTRSMLVDAIELYRDSPRATHWLRRHLDRFAEPLRLAVVGQPGTGRSTLVNALVGDEVAPLLVDDGNQVPTWYRGAAHPRTRVYPAQAPPRDAPMADVDGQPHIDLEGWRADTLDRIVVDWPSPALRALTIIDTPGLDTASDTASDTVSAEADAVLYLMRHPHEVDLGFLRSIQDHPIARATPVNALVVLSRADEVGGGRIDALTSARRVARGYRTDARLRGLCQNVLAVSGLLAHAGRTMTDDEAAALGALAVAPRAELESALLSADRFAGDAAPGGLDARTRLALLDRFGLFGVRLVTALIRQGVDTADELADELVRRSGLAELREAVDRCFTGRQDVLKARSALLALEVVLRMEPLPAARGLATALEGLVTSAHEFRELRLLAALHGGRTTLPDPLAEEARRLVGGDGTALPARLGVDHAADGRELYGAVSDALLRWQEQAENHALGHAQRQAARVVVRSCEGMYAALSGY
ncbi:GTPase [Actinophytocola gossypii]|uniref:50S ribosome-binding GTPase n=1 Tax=Actinophytocola gossypii TaxID=2812003 RepID=A0ABT2JKI9_9PSEU|nr:GTPase [Actinophytocola gossypii]MCT2588049.1 50S ribosome-binding GTPase [Actinophytocola gossypii]